MKALFSWFVGLPIALLVYFFILFITDNLWLAIVGIGMVGFWFGVAAARDIGDDDA